MGKPDHYDVTCRPELIPGEQDTFGLYYRHFTIDFDANGRVYNNKGRAQDSIPIRESV